jgi:glycosyltransferase involved in cell wall biosynthesis
MPKICVLLNGKIKNDSRVIKIIRTLSKNTYVDLFYVNGDKSDEFIFKKNVNLYSVNYEASLSRKLIQHTFFIWEFNFFISLVLNKNINYDYVWCNDLPTLNPGLKISKKLGAKLVYDSHEIYLETLNQFFPRNSRGIKKALFNLNINLMRLIGRNFNKRVLPQVNTFITVNESLREYFTQKYCIQSSRVIMNLPELKKSDIGTNIIDYRSKFSWDKESIILIYQGALNEGRGLHLLMGLMNNIDDKFKLIVLGNGPLKQSLKDLLTPSNQQVKFIDTVPIKKLSDYTRGADIGINLLEDFNLSKKLASPNKLFEYIHAQIPVICSNTIENSKVLQNYKIGLLTENNLTSITEAIIGLSRKSKITFKDEMNGAIKLYNWDRQESEISSIITA